MSTPSRRKAWARMVDSPAWRTLFSSSGYRRLRTTTLFRRIDDTRLRLDAGLRSSAHPRMFDDAETFVVFIGTVKSGGSLLGAMLDAHPETVIADEIDVIRLVELGLDRRRVGQLLRKSARREAHRGRVTARRLGGYSLAVPDQWQGRHTSIRVLGSTRAGPTTRQLGSDPSLLGSISAMASPCPVKLIHVVRNPFDSMSAMTLRSGRSLDSAVADYVAQTERAARLRAVVADPDLLTVRYEDLIDDPTVGLGRACEFLQIEPTEAFLTSCAALVDPDRRPERDQVEWPRHLADEVERRLAGFDFLDGLWSPPRFVDDADSAGSARSTRGDGHDVTATLEC